jgi:hypothetical protein
MAVIFEVTCRYAAETFNNFFDTIKKFRPMEIEPSLFKKDFELLAPAPLVINRFIGYNSLYLFCYNLDMGIPNYFRLCIFCSGIFRIYEHFLQY